MVSAEHDAKGCRSLRDAKATAFPFYFRPWSFDVGKTRYQLLDAGLIDNLAAQPFMPFFVRETPMGEIHKESVWFVSHAGAEMVMPTNAAAEPWATNTKARLLLTDRILRYTVNLSQAVYELMITGFVSDYTNFDVRGVRIGTLPLPYRGTVAVHAATAGRGGSPPDTDDAFPLCA